ncbi:hypothetical protein XENTR_v10009243 [Xenopus tropicalis]|nr:hypothetical protein XENTR_v10009243 [Xenopus tropicalis]
MCLICLEITGFICSGVFANVSFSSACSSLMAILSLEVSGRECCCASLWHCCFKALWVTTMGVNGRMYQNIPSGLF